MSYNAKLLNQPVQIKGQTANLRAGQSTSDPVITVLQKNKPIACVLTGNFSIFGNYKWYQVRLKTKIKGYEIGYLRNDVIILTEKAASQNNNKSQNTVSAGDKPDQDAGNKLLKTVLNNDAILYKRYLVIAEAIINAKQKNIQIPANAEDTLTGLIGKYTNRQTEIQKQLITDGILKSFNKLSPGMGIFPSVFTYLYLKFSKNVNGLGFAWYIPVAIIAAGTVIVSWVLYLLLKRKYTEQQVDLKVSDDLQKALNTLPPEKKEAVLKDLQAQINNAYGQGNDDAKTDNIMKWVKNILLIGVGSIVAIKVVRMLNSSKNKLNQQ